MSKKDKLLEKLVNKQSKLTWREATSLLGKCGYKALSQSSGTSHKKFYNVDADNLIQISEPHPGNELKPYQKAYLIDKLKEIGEL